MADEDDEVEVKKSPLIKIILIAVVSLIVVVGSVVATLFFAGFFDKKASDPVAAVLAGEAEGAPGAGPAAGPPAGPAAGPAAAGGPSAAPGAPGGASGRPAPQPQPQARQAPERVRFQQSYMELERPLLANVTGSRKVMQVRLAIMTHYDERVFNNVKKHEFAIRSAVLDVMRQATEADIVKSTFRVELAERIRLTMNALLEKYEDFGGIEEIHFTEFVFQ
jgi:flagellar FliL protein